MIPPTLRLEVGESQDVITQASTEAGAPITAERAGISYATTDSSIVVIDALGTAIAKRAGRAEVIVRAGGLTRRVSVIVTRSTTETGISSGAAQGSGVGRAGAMPITSTTGVVAVEGTIEPRVIMLLPSERMRPVFKLRFSDGTEAETKEVIWKTYGAPAQVNEATGEVFGITEGSATLGATYGPNISQSVPVQVVAPNLAADRDSVLLVSGNIDTLHLKVPAQNNRIINQGLTWKSTDPSVIRVINASEGIVQARGSGTAFVTVDGFSITRTLPVRVSARIARVETSIPAATPLTMGVGGELSMSARAVDSAGSAVEGAAVRWTIDDTLLATVSARGVIMAHRPGTTVLSVIVEGVSPRTWPITIAATKVSLNVRRAGLPVGTSRQLSVTLRGEAERDFGKPRGAVWSSSAVDVATVDADGTVTARQPGATTIIVRQAGAGADTTQLYVTGRVLIAGTIGARRGIWQMANVTDTAAILLLAVDSANITQAVWSPDRTMIAATVESNEKNGGSRVVVLSATGDGMRVISGNVDLASDPSWTADGAAVLASVRRGSEWSVAKLPVDGGEAVTLASGGDARLRYPMATRESDVTLARIESGSQSDIVRIRGGTVVQALATAKPREEQFTVLSDGRLLIAIDSSGRSRPTTLLIATGGETAYSNVSAVPLPAGFIISDISAGDVDGAVLVTGRTRRWEKTNAPALIIFRVQVSDGQARPLLVLTERDAVTARAP